MEEDKENETDDVYSLDHARAKSALILVDKTNIEMISEIPSTEVKQIAILRSVFGRKFKSDIMNNFIDDYLLYQVSKNRQGRKEIINVATNQPTEKKRRGIMGIFRKEKGE